MARRKMKQGKLNAPGMNHGKHQNLVDRAEIVRGFREDIAEFKEKLAVAEVDLRTEVERLIEKKDLVPSDGHEFKKMPIYRYDLGDGPKVIRYGKNSASVSVGDAKTGSDGVDVSDDASAEAA